MKKIITLYVIVFLFTGFTNSTNAQKRDNKGTNFWFTFPTNCGICGIGERERFVVITSAESTTGTVSVPALGINIPFAVTAGGDTAVLLPFYTLIAGVHVTSVKEVTVYGYHSLIDLSDGFLALPTDVLGTEYINLGYKNKPEF